MNTESNMPEVPDFKDALPADVSEETAALVTLHNIADNVFHTLPLGLVVFDRSMRVWHVNAPAAFLVQLEQSVVEALCLGAAESRYEDWEAELRRVLDTRMPAQFEQITHRDPAGQERILNLSCTPLTSGNSKEVIGGLLVVNDVTAGISMEKRLAVSERMAALGKLAAKVAHELNNPLDGILRYLGLAQRVIEQNQPDKAKHYLEQSRAGLLRMAQIVTDLLEFSRNARTSPDDASLNAVIEESVKVMHDKAAHNGVSVVCAFEESLPIMRGGGNLFQVFCNIIKNAIDAMENGGTLTISSMLNGNEAVIKFEDTGHGLNDPIERIFEPFYTTKGPGKGTGLGLPVCRDIVEKHNGRLIAENRDTGGARFTVVIPLAGLTIRKEAPRGAPGPYPTR